MSSGGVRDQDLYAPILQGYGQEKEEVHGA